MRHPLHPMLVHLPIGLWLASLIFDIVYLLGGNASFAIASFYCIAIGIVGALLAAPAGFAEYLEIPAHTRPKRLATTHMVLNLGIVALYAVNFFIRQGQSATPPTQVTTGAFILSLVSMALLSVSGYFGGLLVFEFGIGFRPENRDRKHEDEPKIQRVA